MKNNKTKKRGGENGKNKVPNGKNNGKNNGINNVPNGKKVIPFENQPFMTRAAQSGLLTEAIFTGAKLMGKAGKTGATLMNRAGRAGFSLAKNATGHLLKSVKLKNASKPNNGKITGNNSATSKNAPKPNNVRNNVKKTTNALIY